MSVFIGRDQELNTLEKALHSARDGIGCCILLTGEAGIGKSRLIEELKHQATLEKFTILQGDCFEQAVSFPYAPWIDALRASITSLSTTEIEEFLGPLAPEFMKLLPELALLLPQIHPAPPLEPLAEKYRLFESFTRFGTSLSTLNPVLFILEDLHWSDGLSLELFQYFVHRIRNQPLMLVGTYRSEEPSPHLVRLLSKLNRERLVQEIALRPLDRDEVEQITCALLKTQDRIPASIADALLALTDGNPFFVEEVLKSLTEEGHINELLQYKSLDELPVPRSIQRMVQQRVEQLAETTRRILIPASVIGQRFDFGLLQEITAQDEQELLRALKELIDAHLVVQESADQFAFKHALTRDAVYSMLMLRERKAMHQTIGEVFERLYGKGTDSHVSELAYHFYQAEAWQKALEYAQRAGENAQALYAPHEAITFFTQAIQAAQRLDIEPVFTILRSRARAFEVLGEFDSALGAYEKALKSATHIGDRSGECITLVDLGFLWQSRDWKLAGDYFQRAMNLARELADRSLLAQTLNRVGNWHMNRGQAREALPFHHDALELFRQLEDRRGMAQTMDLLGIVSYQLGEVIQGAAYLEQSVPILRELDDRQGLVHTLTNLTVRALTDTEVLGDINYMQLADLSEEALELARSFNWYQGELLAILQGAISLGQAGEYGHALGRLDRALSMAEESRNRESFARLHLILGRIFSELLALTEATHHLEMGLNLVQELGSGLLMLGATSELATVAVLQKDFARANALLAELLPAEYPKGDEQPALRRCWSACAEIELVQGNPRRALEIVERLLASTPNLAQYGPHAVPRLSRLRGQALTALGRPKEAVAEFVGAQATARTQGARPLLWRLHDDLGKVYRAMGHDDAEREFSSARVLIQDLADRVPEGALRDNFLKQALAALPAPPALTPRQVAKKEFGGLTAREREIAALIAQGKSNRNIADELVISETTAERHVANILSKLGFNSRTQIAVWVVEKGLGK